MTFTITQDNLSTTAPTRDAAHRIARKSLDTGKGDVTITGPRGKVVAVLTQKDRVASGERWG